MTVGENIRRLRKERNLTIQELADMVGVHESYIRAYETGRRHPKLESLEKLAEALNVNVEVLLNSEMDGVKAMHWLFQISRQYRGKLFKYEDERGREHIAITFNFLPFMKSWYNKQEEYFAACKEIGCEDADEISKEDELLLRNLETEYDHWMDTFPEKETKKMIKEQAKYDQIMEKVQTTWPYGNEED